MAAPAAKALHRTTLKRLAKQKQTQRNNMLSHIRAKVYGGSHEAIDLRTSGSKLHDGLAQLKRPLEGIELSEYYGAADTEETRLGGYMHRDQWSAYYHEKREHRLIGDPNWKTYKERYRDKRPKRKDFEWRYGWY